MNMSKCGLKKIFACLSMLFVSAVVFPEAINDMQLFKADSWVYSAIERLGTEAGALPVTFYAPLTAGELKLYFSDIDRESLSESGKLLYDDLENFLYTKPKQFGFDDVYAAFNIKLNPEFYVKTNKNIDWTYNYYYNDNIGTVSLLFGLSNYFTVDFEPFVGKNHGAMHKSGNFTNLPLSVLETEFQQPRWANISFGYNTNNWGINFILGKEGMQIGPSLTGSIIYNRTFMTDFFSQINVYSKIFKIAWGVAEVSANRFLYNHQIEVRPFKKIRLAIGESGLLASTFEVRFLNPVMIYHSFAVKRDYNKEERAFYGQTSFCDVLEALIEYAPIPTSRFYIYYVQNEVRFPWENDREMPNSIGFQLGTVSSFNAPGNGYWTLGLEGIWTTPYLYIKQGAPWSLYKDYYPNHTSGTGQHVYSWIGSPFGPDCMGGEIKFGYEKSQKWSADFIWVFTAHGEKGVDMFKQTIVDEDGNEWYFYYPGVKYKHAKTEEEKQAALDDASYLLPSGIVEYKNQVAIKGEYNFNRHFSVGGQIVYIFAYNFKNVSGNFQQGAEFTISGTYKLF